MLVGRKKEIAVFNKCLESSQSSFIAVYGRRRVGKTFLVKSFFKELRNEVDIFEYTGSHKLTARKEIIRINKKLLKLGFKGKAESWIDIFDKLQDLVISSTKKKIVIFLDEVPWLDKKNSDFLNELSQFWDTFASVHGNVVLIISGSSGSWMRKMVFENSGHMYNRVLDKIILKPFSLKESGEFLSKVKDTNLSMWNLVKLFFYYGGIPYYLSKYDPLKGIEENISYFDDKFYEDEYKTLIDSIFGNGKGHREIITKLVGKKGQSRDLLIRGDLNPKTYEKALKELIDSDFVSQFKSYKDRKMDSYLLVDEFFQNYFNRDLNSSSMGLRFEKVVLKHIDSIVEYINEESVDVYFDISYNNSQIDLVIVGKYTLYLLEIKHYIESYSVSNHYLAKLDKRKSDIFDWLMKMGYRKKEIKVGFITVNGLTNSSSSRKLLDIKMEDL